MNWNITAGRPVYVQLIEQLELALVAGEFPPGSRIPPVRELAADAGVNPNTMQRALQELEGRGLLQAQRTAGRTVTADDAALRALRRRRAKALAEEFLFTGKRKVDFFDYRYDLIGSPLWQRVYGTMPCYTWVVRDKETQRKVKPFTKNIIFENYLPVKE